jgi:hypothetical protein
LIGWNPMVLLFHNGRIPMTQEQKVPTSPMTPSSPSKGPLRDEQKVHILKAALKKAQETDRTLARARVVSAQALKRPIGI